MEVVLLSPHGRTVLVSPVVSIGSAGENHLVVDDAKVAAQHAELRLVGEGYTITDLANTNGTFINAQRLAPNVPHPLTTGDMLRIGTTDFKYEGGSGAQAASAPESVGSTAATSATGEPAYSSTPTATAPTFAASAPASVGSTEVTSSTGEPAYPSTLPATAPTFAASAPESVGSTEVTSSTGEPAYPSTPTATAPTFAATAQQASAPASVASSGVPSSLEAILLSPAGRTVLTSAVVSIGSAGENDLVVKDPKIASQHAELRRGGEGYTITSLTNTNGTFVNAQRLASNVPHSLTTGDIIRVGDTAFRYEVTGGAQVASAPASVGSTEDTSITGEPAYPSTLSATAPTFAASAPESVDATEVTSATGEPAYSSTLAATAPTDAASASAPQSVGSTEVTSSLEAILLSPAGRTILTSAVVSIGNARENHLVVKDAKVASQHAELRRGEEGYTITSLTSTNGTFVNGQRLAPNVSHPLATGDMLRFGNTPFRYEVRDGAQVASAPQSVDSTAATSATGEPTYSSTLAATASTYAAASQASAPQSVGSTEVTSTTGEPAYSSTPTATAPTYAATSASAPSFVAPTEVTSTTGEPAYSSTFSATAPSYAAATSASAPASVGSTAVPGSRVPAQPKKSSWWRRVTLVAIAVAVLTAIVTSVVVFTTSSPPSSAQALDTFCTALTKGDYQTAYNQYSPQFQKTVPEAQFKKTFTTNKVTACTHNSPTQSGNNATATLMLVQTSGTSSRLATLVTESNGSWKINGLRRY